VEVFGWSRKLFRIPRESKPVTCTCPPRSAPVVVDSTCLFRVRVVPGSSILNDVRAFIGAYVRSRFTIQAADRIEIALQELLENAMKYGSLSSDVVVELHEPGELTCIELRVGNAAVGARLKMLADRIEELKSSNPEDAYRAALLKMASGPSSRSMLGLARIRHEARMELEAYIQGSQVTVIARSKDYWRANA
jgi:hypothetical protein